MITCVIEYDFVPHQLADFERYATAWPPIIERCGGDLVGYYLPKEGANNRALALINFPSLSAYEKYRARLVEDPDGAENVRLMRESGCVRAESRSFLRKV